MIDLLNYDLLDDCLKQFSPMKYNESIFDKSNESQNYVLSGFSYSTGVIQPLSKVYKHIY